ncbi:uncharacterized protein LOC118739742 [Rhagoletis pomonella]|uniref:uncharacterized protein LOC118739742 n=1 Tax=Rhagoletis pomonella TaxID=28610 RepID=UPI001780AAD9|nr:uncharacterized protein LOC118739742 [Rhagoletis pomonella]
MHPLAADESSTYPIGAETVHGDLYVDDLIAGGDSTEEVLYIKLQTTSLLGQGNFKFKWGSNSPGILRDVPDVGKESFLKFDDGSDITKALGIILDSVKDKLLFSFVPQRELGKNSKRSALFTLARCYDPLGLIGPTLTKAKILLQRMWRDKLECDVSLPQLLNTAWSAFCNGFADTQHLSFPRYVLQPGAITEIHAFCDARLEAFEAWVYTRSAKDSNVQVYLLCSKARVAPLKTITVPKLERCAATMIAQLMENPEDLHVLTPGQF